MGWFLTTGEVLSVAGVSVAMGSVVLQLQVKIFCGRGGRLKVIVHKLRGEVSLVEQHTIECVFLSYFKCFSANTTIYLKFIFVYANFKKLPSKVAFKSHEQ